MQKLFGTDGIRAPAGQYPLDRETVTRVGAAVAESLRSNDSNTTVVIGGDTRQSTSEIATWLSTGLASSGAEVLWAGIIPTPGVAFLVRDLNAHAGIAISASHNPYSDNGIKLLDASGQKWSTQKEKAIEEALSRPSADLDAVDRQIEESSGLSARYAAHLESILPGNQPLSGLRICLDLANGAAGPLAGPLFRKLGAKVHTIFDQPNGVNINAACGSTEPAALAEATRNLECDLGVAFDGDADRAVLVDELGVVWDGDAILMLWALALQRDGKLNPPRVVATTMSNLGLQVVLGEQNIEVISCDVGDRQVVEAMQREGIVLGGEQSGHVIYSDVMTTGDGLVTALQVAYEVKTSGQPLSETLRRFRRFPQVLRNVRVKSKPDLSTLAAVQSAVQDIERTLGDQGRLVLRYSGTEPLARVMIEGPDETEVETLVDQLVAVIQTEIGE